MTASGREIEDNLCVGCGLCCDGTLHGEARLERGEGADAIAAGLDVVEGENSLTFRLPCPLFKNGCCSVYPDRPAVCGSYECKLLKSVKNGELTVQSAREKVETAKALRSKVAEHNPEAVFGEHRSRVWKSLQDGLPSLDPAGRRAAAQSILDIAVFDEFLDRWFGQRKSKLGTESSNSRRDEPERG